MMMSAIKGLGALSLVNVLVLLVATPSFAQTEFDYESSADVLDTANLTPDTWVAQRSRNDNDRINYFGVGGTIGVSDDGYIKP